MIHEVEYFKLKAIKVQKSKHKVTIDKQTKKYFGWGLVRIMCEVVNLKIIIKYL